jgi:hypothetical protein
MKKEKIDILKTDAKLTAKWSKLPLFYKILMILLMIAIAFVPILMFPDQDLIK